MSLARDCLLDLAPLETLEGAVGLCVTVKAI
jgi:hypothetical protein